MNDTPRKRQPSGTPVGGRFAATQHDESDMTLSGTRDPLEQAVTDVMIGDISEAEGEARIDALVRIQRHPDFFCPVSGQMLDIKDAVMVEVREDGEWTNPTTFGQTMNVYDKTAIPKLNEVLPSIEGLEYRIIDSAGKVL